MKKFKIDEMYMKKIIVLIVCFICFACDSESTLDCFQTAGSTIEQEFTVDAFNRILVNRDISLIIKQGPQKVIVETGENLLNDVTVEVINDQLILTDNNTCNFVRDIGVTKIYVTTPNLSEIRCSTQLEIISDGVLNFQNLNLFSEDFGAPDTFPIGDFRLQLNTTTLNIVSNNISFFYLSGIVENLNINFANGNGRFEGRNLTAQNVSIFHRGTNDVLINPQQSITGSIVSTGDVIAFNQPAVINVEETFTGRLIFE